jgi:hypothetical protein
MFCTGRIDEGVCPVCRKEEGGSHILKCEGTRVWSSVSQPFSMEEPLRYIFISRGTPTYENVYRQQKFDSGERKSIAARLLSGKFYVKICYIFYIHSFTGAYSPGRTFGLPFGVS